MEHASLDTALELTPISRDEIAQKKTSMPREELRPMFDKLVAHAAEKKASDIFINTENYISIKTDGQLNYTKKYMEEGDVYNLIEVISRPEAFREFLRNHELHLPAGQRLPAKKRPRPRPPSHPGNHPETGRPRTAGAGHPAQNLDGQTRPRHRHRCDR